ncbi:probable protein phosphatase 1N [Pongo pygmaeus]|uniref:probable protein phosphatase 1N isoform X1 n=1 Tax=Pongo abelii TaxID=9601 RepID=UPI0023E10D50|nr:probable protein phosphatase 1N isoform X1 [Pongo abelii]XP_054319671.1 probable protein phosphatase 1N [Pongo pygmaeus]
MAALARQLQRLLWTACKKKEREKEGEEEEKEEEAGRRAPDGLRSLLTAPRRAQRPHGGAEASGGLRFGASAAQGWRARMEDAHCTWLSLPGLPPGWALFAVLDGHGGARAARFGARHLPSHVLEELGPEPSEPEGVREALRRAFLSTDERLRSLWPRVETGGSTAVTLLVSPRFLYLAHCGDSRAVLSRAGAVAFSTEDHRPLRPRERERIHAAGGTIRRRRVEGSLAVSRALGDFAYKEAPGRPPELQLVSAEPEVAALARQAEDEFMLLASDGVWDTVSGAALAGLVASRLRLGLAPELLCAQLLDTCLCKGSLDNMTCILVCFPGAPRPSEEAIRRELALDAALGRRIAELCASAQEPPSLNTVFRTLASEDIPDLPPGGGLDCKATVIAEVYSQICQVSEECREKGQDGAGKSTPTHLGSALDTEG